MIICGDVHEELPKLPDEHFDLIIADPPYVVTKEDWDKEVVDEVLVKELYRVLADHGSLYVWCGIGEKSQSLIRWFPLFAAQFTFKDMIVWKKRRGIGTRRGWLLTREECLWFVKGHHFWDKDEQYSDEPTHFGGGNKNMQGKKIAPFKRHTNVWTDIPEILGPKGIDHPTPKPIKAIKRIIEVHTMRGDTVLDLFSGSGTTAIACKELKRECVAIEKDVRYAELIKERLRDT